jgi:hypothetical protein
MQIPDGYFEKAASQRTVLPSNPFDRGVKWGSGLYEIN